MNKKIKKNIYAMALASVIGSSTLMGCGNSDHEDKVSTTIETADDKKIEPINFSPYEQIVSVCIDKKKELFKEIIQYDAYEGYEPVAFSFESWGTAGPVWGGLNIVFSNNCEVIAPPSEIGKPVDSYENSANSYVSDNTYVFDAYQHILSVPIGENDCYDVVKQYPFHEGYKLIGMDTLVFGSALSVLKNEVLLYTNTCPVEVKNYAVEDGKVKCCEFGRPITLENSNEKVNQKVK